MIIAGFLAFSMTQVVGLVILFALYFLNTARLMFLNRYVNEGFESKYRATAVSSLNLLVSLVYVLLVSVSGVVIERLNVGIVYFVCAAVGLLMILPLGIMLSKEERCN